MILSISLSTLCRLFLEEFNRGVDRFQNKSCHFVTGRRSQGVVTILPALIRETMSRSLYETARLLPHRVGIIVSFLCDSKGKVGKRSRRVFRNPPILQQRYRSHRKKFPNFPTALLKQAANRAASDSTSTEPRAARSPAFCTCLDVICVSGRLTAYVYIARVCSSASGSRRMAVCAGHVDGDSPPYGSIVPLTD